MHSDELRNRRICEDVIECVRAGRSPLVLTGETTTSIASSASSRRAFLTWWCFRSRNPSMSDRRGDGAAELKSRFAAQGVGILGAGPREFGKIIQEEVGKWTKLVKRATIAGSWM